MRLFFENMKVEYDIDLVQSLVAFRIVQLSFVLGYRTRKVPFCVAKILQKRIVQLRAFFKNMKVEYDIDLVQNSVALRIVLRSFASDK